MTGIWFVSKNNVIQPYSDTQDSMEGCDVPQRIWDLMMECESGDVIQIACELPE
jgi:hypothetical protein